MPPIELASVLRAVPNCPVCGAADREPNRAPAGSTSPYTRTVAEMLGLGTEELFAKVPLWICRSCSSTWHDPWFTLDFAETFYGYVCGQHFYGWLGLIRWLQQKPATFVATRSAIWTLLRQSLPGQLTYAELNCPTAGMAFAELDARDGPASRDAGLARIRDLSRVYGKSSVMDRPSAAQSAAAALSPPAAGEGFLIQRTLLTEDSPFCWRRSCVHGGVSCHAFAQNFLFDRIMPLPRAEESGVRFDLIGAFVILDHIPEPLAVMQRLLAIGTRLLLEIHGPGWTDLQHFYAFGERFQDLVENRGVHIRDLTSWSRSHGVPGPSNGSRFYMLSNEDDLSWLPERTAA